MPDPGPGEVLVHVALAGVNFGDTHQREGQYVAQREVPFVLGGEVAGTVDGERVVALLDTGGYAEYAVAPADRVFRVPDGLADGAAPGAARPGAHRMAPVAHVGQARRPARAWWCTPPRAGWEGWRPSSQSRWAPGG